MHWFWKNKYGLLAIAGVSAATLALVNRLQTPGHLDVLTAQAMDMSEMRPPTGAAPVDLAAVRAGALAATVTYTGSVQAYNEQDIAPRVTGTITALPVYPGDSVRAGELVARLDTAELSARAQTARDQARQAEAGEEIAVLTHHLHHSAALDQARAQDDAADAGVRDAQAQERQAREAIAEAQAGVAAAEANAAYWRVEIAREKQLADAGAASRQEYQNELAQAQTADAALAQARSKAAEAQAALDSAQAKERSALHQAAAARSGVRMAQADMDIEGEQIRQDRANAAAARSAAREAAVVEDYTRIASPANGVVTARPVAPGTLVQPGTTILRIAEIDRVRVQANVAVADLDGIAAGTPVTISFGGRKTSPVRARVTSVFPAADPDTRTAVVEAVIPNPGHRLLPGAFAALAIEKPGAPSSLMVPAAAVVREGGQAYIWIARSGAAAAQYRASGCGQLYSAADARKYHYICPMDHSRLVPVASKAAPGSLTAHRIPIREGGSDGTWTEAASPELQPDDRVVRHGQAGLVEGAALVPTPWGLDGPQSLPMASQTGSGARYRCEKCGMTYSAADAKKYGYHDPMDGGKLVAE